jgi:hypothetical protein
MMPGGSSSQYGQESRGFSEKRYPYLHRWGSNPQKKGNIPNHRQSKTPLLKAILEYH